MRLKRAEAFKRERIGVSARVAATKCSLNLENKVVAMFAELHGEGKVGSIGL